MIAYMDHSRIRPGKLDQLRAAIFELAGFVEANEPDILAYNVYFDEDGTEMTVFHVHRDSASLAFHMRVAGPAFARFGELIDMLAIDLYGRPSDDLLAQIRAKAELLGSGIVRVHGHHAGFARFEAR